MKAVDALVAFTLAAFLAGCGGDPRSQPGSEPENGVTYFYYYGEAVRCLNLNSTEAIADAISHC